MYSHKMNKNQFKHKIEFCYNYEPKNFDINMRSKVDANMILKELINKGIDIKKDYELILLNLPNKDYNNNDSIDYIKLNCYLRHKKELLNTELLCQPHEVRKEKLKELFYKYFNVSGDFMLTIKLN